MSDLAWETSHIERRGDAFSRVMGLSHKLCDAVAPLARSERLAELTGGALAVLDGAGHIPNARDAVQVNELIAEFARRFGRPEPRRTWTRWDRRSKRVLYLDEKVCVVSVGGSGVGGDLVRRVIDAYPQAARLVPGLRMIVVTGPRLDPAQFQVRPGLSVHGYLSDLPARLAAADLAIVQGGLTTTMELTALGRPLIYVPFRHHFEQQFHVAHRLRRYGAGRRMDYAELEPDVLAEAIAAEIGRKVDYRPVPMDGARRAGALLAELL